MAAPETRTDTTQEKRSPDIEATLFAIVKELGQELHLREAVLDNLSLKTSIDSDLGLDSLTRMELLSRIERSLCITLSAESFVNISDLGQLRKIIVEARADAPLGFAHQTSPLKLDAVKQSPGTCTTLTEVIEWHMQSHPERPHIKLYSDSGEGEVISYRDLYQSASAVACGLNNRGVQQGDTVAIMLPTGRDYFCSFIGVLLAGAIPVSLYPPARINQIEDHLHRHGKIVINCGAKALLTFARAKQVARLLKAQAPALQRIYTVNDIADPNGQAQYPRLRSVDTAFLQYTSGSTGQPKGVVLSHANILANIRAMGEWMRVTAQDVIVSWLPLYHDMGLIGCWLGSLYYSCLFVVMSPLDFLARPERWLWAIHRYRGTISAAPNFAYELCLKRVRADYIVGLDLSSWRAALNGAEAVSPKTLARFGQYFQDYGLRPETLMPVYGLAENAVGLTFPPMGRGPVVDQIDRHIFTRSGRAAPATDATKILELVACGRPLHGNELRIVDAMDKEVGEHQEGRLQFRGPSATTGYYQNPEQTKKLVRGNWWETGDKAYLANGDIYITGRSKDIIVHGGRNLYPEELEEAVGDIDNIRKGCVAVFGSHNATTGTEKLVVLAETRVEDAAVVEQLRRRINLRAVDIVGAPPDDVVLVPPHTVLKTSSGKIRRSASRELYECGNAGVGARPLALQLMHLLALAIVPTARRILRTASSLIYAAWFWLVVALFSPPIWLSILLTPVKTWRWRLMSCLGQSLARLLGIRCQLQDHRHLPTKPKPCIYVANHASYLDVFALLTYLPWHYRFVAKMELSRHWFIRVILKRVDVLFVERLDKQHSLEDADHFATLAKTGASLFFFPEGTFTRVAGVYPFRMGAFLTAVAAEIPVLPIAIRGTRSALHPGAWFPRRGNLTITIGDAITADKGENEWERAVKLRDEARSFILAHCGEADLAQEIPLTINRPPQH